jgi:hypothetical protein
MLGTRTRNTHTDVDQGRNGQDEQQVQHNKPPLSEYTRVGRLGVVTDDGAEADGAEKDGAEKDGAEKDSEVGGTTGRMIADVVVYTVARLALVGVLTAAIFYAARWIGITEFPLVIAMLFAIVITLPLGIWLLAPLRRRATAGIAEVDERRRHDREQLQARLRGEDPPE